LHKEELQTSNIIYYDITAVKHRGKTSVAGAMSTVGWFRHFGRPTG